MLGAQPPTTYHQWVECLDQLEAGANEEPLLAAMEAGALEWTSGVTERFVERLSRCINTRLRSSAASLQRDLTAGQGTEGAVVSALLDARRRIHRAHRLARLPVLPAYVQEELCHAVQSYADRAQESLERSARTDRTGRLAGLIRGNPLNRLPVSASSAPTEPATSSTPSLPPGPSPVAGGLGRRRILF